MSRAEPMVISTDLKLVLRRLRLSPILETLPERITLARQRKMPHQDFMLSVLRAEVERRDGAAAQARASKARLDPEMRLEQWDETAKVKYDHELWAELVTLRFIEEHHHVLVLGPVGVGKTFLANALGHIACRRGYSALAIRADDLFKQLKVSRLDQTHEREMRRLLGLDLLILDDFALDHMDATESRDLYDIALERHRCRSIIVTSNREPAEWLPMLADPIRAQSTVDRLQNAAYELVIDGESYRQRQKPKLPSRSRSKKRR